MSAPRCPACGLSKVDFARTELDAMGDHADELRDEVLEQVEHRSHPARRTTSRHDAADDVARIVASWGFPITVLALILIWLLVNFAVHQFTPFPTVLLAGISAVLASLGALQAPIILRVQRHQRMRDRDRDEIDHRVNLRAEVEVRWLHHKLDHVLGTNATESTAQG